MLLVFWVLWKLKQRLKLNKMLKITAWPASTAMILIENQNVNSFVVRNSKGWWTSRCPANKWSRAVQERQKKDCNSDEPCHGTSLCRELLFNFFALFLINSPFVYWNQIIWRSHRSRISPRGSTTGNFTLLRRLLYSRSAKWAGMGGNKFQVEKEQSLIRVSSR
jgi:hypothetical protein